MEVHLYQTYSLLVILAAAIVALLVTYLVYLRNDEDILSKPQKRFLAVIRFLSFFLIALLITKPLIKRIKNKKIDSIFIVAVDNSESMIPNKEKVSQLLKDVEQEIAGTTLKIWQFGEQASPSSELQFSDKQSNYSDILKELIKDYLNSQIRGVLLLGDGIFNEGEDPSFVSKSVPFPIFTVGIGDTTLHVDLAIKNVITNKQAFLNDYFPVELNLDFSMAAGQQVELTIENETKQVYKKAILISSNQQFYSDLVSLKADREGINNFHVKLSTIDSEKNQANNNFDFSVQVIAEKQKILLLGSGAHPDIAALHQSLLSNQNFDIEIITGIKPSTNFEDFDLIVAHQLPSKNREFIPITEKLIKSNRPVLFVIGQESSIPYLNSIQKNFQIEAKQGLYENPIASINERFNLFTLSTDYKATFAKFPPLISPFGNVTVGEDFQTLAFQNTQGIETKNPLISVGLKNGVKQGFIAGEGVWRWRLYDYLQNGSHQYFDDIFLKIVNYLIIKPGDDNFNIHCPSIFLENESVVMQAELFNASNELINEPAVNIELNTADSIDYHFVFDRQNQQYQLNAGRLPIGDYTYQATTELAGEKLVDTGYFRVSTSQQEQMETRANFQILNKISANTGGQFIDANNSEKLDEVLREINSTKHQIVKQEIFQELLDIKWLFLIVLVLFSVEWFLRKFWGTY
ncbi:hypothetical protein ACUNWD_02435 [Sunxiuqinia sp. A32]|uniref:hypothetical protein n=1 Tax=Sunxiuqinia sp. A32 TaxID=3461496 RepID=UPI0040458C90